MEYVGQEGAGVERERGGGGGGVEGVLSPGPAQMLNYHHLD